MNLMMLLEMANSAFADRTAFTNSEDGSSITYQELFDQSGKAARAAQSSDSEHFAIRDVNSLAMPIGIFCQFLGRPAFRPAQLPTDRGRNRSTVITSHTSLPGDP